MSITVGFNHVSNATSQAERVVCE